MSSSVSLTTTTTTSSTALVLASQATHKSAASDSSSVTKEKVNSVGPNVIKATFITHQQRIDVRIHLPVPAVTQIVTEYAELPTWERMKQAASYHERQQISSPWNNLKVIISLHTLGKYEIEQFNPGRESPTEKDGTRSIFCSWENIEEFARQYRIANEKVSSGSGQKTEVDIQALNLDVNLDAEDLLL